MSAVPHPRPHRVAARGAAGLAIVVLFAGCGASRPPIRQRVEIRRTLSTFMRALAAGNGRLACGELTPTGQASVIATIGPELANFGIDTCTQAIRVTGSELTAGLRRQLASVRVGAVALNGSAATVPWSAITSPGGDVAAYFGHPKPVTLTDVNGLWEIASL